MNRSRTADPDRTSEARGRALEAFRLLMLERGYRRVTIQSVLDRARIGRATFYVHFRGKEDLLAASVAGLVRDELGATKDRSPDEVGVQFLVGAPWGVMTWWARRMIARASAVGDGVQA